MNSVFADGSARVFVDMPRVDAGPARLAETAATPATC
jgi:hypothetical protein